MCVGGAAFIDRIWACGEMKRGCYCVGLFDCGCVV